MIASVHVADLGVVAALSAARRTSLHRTVSGLRHANLAFAAPLGPSAVPRPSLHRVVMVAMWDGDAALDRFLATDHFAEVFQNGWHLRLQPLRASGSWPGLDFAIPRAREVPHEGPVAVLVLGGRRVNRTLLRKDAVAGGVRPSVGVGTRNRCGHGSARASHCSSR